MELSRDFIIESLLEQFRNRERFTREELYNFFAQFDPDLKETTFRWRIYNLKEKKIIRPISNSEYTLSYKPEFNPKLEKKQQELFNLVKKQYSELKFCIWNTKWLHEFMLHLPGRSLTLLEVEKSSLESVFFYLKDERISNVFLQPEEKELNFYISEHSSPVILKALISKGPLRKVGKFTIPTLEKVLVDLYVDTSLFEAFQGRELAIIYNNAFNKYSINFTKLFSYAKRRGKETSLMEFIHTKTDIPKSLLND